MGNACSHDNKAIEKVDVFDFRLREDDITKAGKLQALKVEEETDVSTFKEHLVSIQKDPYDDKYP
jgi:hypothetical protein